MRGIYHRDNPYVPGPFASLHVKYVDLNANEYKVCGLPLIIQLSDAKRLKMHRREKREYQQNENVKRRYQSLLYVLPYRVTK